jgi:hypothetical protein
MQSVYREHNNKQRLWELLKDLYWHTPDKVFESCNCGAAPHGTHCDRVQVLIPGNYPRILRRGFQSPPEPLPAHGAVIFGHSVTFPLIWPKEASSVPTEGHPQGSQPASQSSNASDSGLGTSVASSSVNVDSISQESSVRPASNVSTHGGAASGTGSDGSTKSGIVKVGKDISKLLPAILKGRARSKKTGAGAITGENSQGSS